MTIDDHTASAARRPKLRALTRTDVDFDNLLLAAAPRFEASVEDRTVTVRVVPGTEAPVGLCMSGTFDGAEVQMSIPAAVLPALVPGMAADIPVDQLPDALAMAVAAVALAPLLDGAGQALGGQFVCTGPPVSSPKARSALSLRIEAGATLVNITPGSAAVTMMHERLRALAPADGWQGAADVLVPVQPEFARIDLDLAELRSLRRGDVALLPVGCDPDALRLLVGMPGTPFATARRDGTSVSVETVSGRQMQDDDDFGVAPDSDMADAEAGADDLPAGDFPIDDLKVEISFCLGPQLLTVAQLRNLAPGFIFALDESASGEVIIATAGREIGRGELVQIDDRLGVRIVSLKVVDDG